MKFADKALRIIDLRENGTVAKVGSILEERIFEWCATLKPGESEYHFKSDVNFVKAEVPNAISDEEVGLAAEYWLKENNFQSASVGGPSGHTTIGKQRIRFVVFTMARLAR